jgi:hypothetical protein
MAGKKGIDPEVAELWAEEAERRYQKFLEGKVEAVPGEEALKRIRAALDEGRTGTTLSKLVPRF